MIAPHEDCFDWDYERLLDELQLALGGGDPAEVRALAERAEDPVPRYATSIAPVLGEVIDLTRHQHFAEAAERLARWRAPKFADAEECAAEWRKAMGQDQ